MPLICLDTNILIAGIRQQSNDPTFDHNAKIFLETLAQDDNNRYLIPSVVLAEFMVGAPKHERDIVLAQFSQYRIATFDVGVARISG
jgi:predicted nucleic acid-binding protein